MARRLVATVSSRAVDGERKSRQFGSATEAVLSAFDLLREESRVVTVVVSVLDLPEGEAIRGVKHGETLLASLLTPGLFLTLTTQDLVRSSLEEDVIYDDFGVHTGVERSDRVFGLIHADLPQPERPPIKQAGNCPRPQRSFIGREDETSRLQDLLLERNLITILGPPGVGKSALALRVARCMLDECTDGVWWFNVEDCASMDALLARIGAETNLVGLTQVHDLARVAERLATKDAIIVLDGCEHLATKVAQFCEAVLKQTSTLTVLTTSTRRLDLPGECVLVVSPMSTSSMKGDPTEHALLESDALNLFYERAGESGGLLSLDSKTIRTALEICRLADGLPIVIELLAASLRQIGLDGMRKALEQGRSQELEGRLVLFDPAYELLSEPEAKILQRLALFESAWTLPVAIELFDDVDAEAMRQTHELLFDRSWFTFDIERGSYRMLKPLRRYVGIKIADEDRARFNTRLAQAVHEWRQKMLWSDGDAYEERLDRHYGDFVGALRWELSHSESGDVLEALFAYLCGHWIRQNVLDEAVELSEAVGKRATGVTAARVDLMIGIAALRRRQYEAAESRFQRAFETCHAENYLVGEGGALCNLATTYSEAGRNIEALELHGKALDLLRAAGEPHRLGNALINACENALVVAELHEERRDECLALVRAQLMEFSRLNLNNPLLWQAELHNVARLAEMEGDDLRAEATYRKAIAVCDAHGLRHEAFDAVHSLSSICLRRGDPEMAAKFAGLANQIQQERGHMPSDLDLQHTGATLARLRALLGAQRCENLMRYGARLQLNELGRPLLAY